MNRTLNIINVCFLLILATGFVRAEEPLKARITLDKSVADKAIAGRLFLFLSKRKSPEPKAGPNWFRPEPFFARQVNDFQPGSSMEIDDSADSFPAPISELKAGKYYAQALLDQDFYSASPGMGVGNFFSDVIEFDHDPERSTTIELTLAKTIAKSEFAETEFIKLVEMPSKLLSDFHKRQVTDQAVVVLPASYYQQPKKRYPVLYVISGFGGTIDRVTASYRRGPPTAKEGEAEMIRVLLTGQCKWGHHVYANSATNGPRGDSLISELIPLIDANFRTVADARARFVGGHSSGGWSSLWLQVNYPDTFGGVWSTSPDPVDFRDFQQVNLYAKPPQSLYFNQAGEKRPLARSGDRVMIWYPDFALLDDTLGSGGQLRSFEAVFSPLGKDGLPVKLWDRQTGNIDPELANAWKSYDIRLILEENWDELKQDLAGKLHVTMGDLDTFYLEGATLLLKESLEKLGSDAEVTIVAGADHGSVLNKELFDKQRKQISESYLRHFHQDGSAR